MIVVVSIPLDKEQFAHLKKIFEKQMGRGLTPGEVKECIRVRAGNSIFDYMSRFDEEGDEN